MKNLKKLLALVLVAVMVLSFGAISASAAFADTAASSYQEAIEVLSGIGVIDGTTATTFAPEGNLDRASAAKIITYMLLGPVNAAQIKNATSQTFSDVPTSHWASGYIAYCASKGIISGAGDGTFNPSGTLKTVEFTKMLLVALGYNAEAQGYTGSNWAVNIASDAIAANISDFRIPISATTVCTREQAAQLAFLTLTADTVRYTGGSSMTVNGVTITTGATRETVPGSIAAGANYNGDVGDGKAQFCETYFPALKFVATAVVDANGIAGHKWQKSGKDISGVYNTAKLLASSKNGTAWASLTNVNSPYYIGFKADNAVAYKLNGAPSSLGATETAAGKAGQIVDFYDTDFDNLYDTVCVTVKSYTKLAAAPVTSTNSAGEAIVTISSLGKYNVPAISLSGYEGLAKNDYVLYWTSDANGVTFVEKAASVTGVVTGFSSTFGVKVDGVYHADSKLDGDDNFNGYTSGDYVNTYTFYLDNSGAVIKSEQSSAVAATNLAVVASMAYVPGSGVSSTNHVEAKIVKTDGTTEVVTVASIDSIPVFGVGATGTGYDDTSGAGGAEINTAAPGFVTGYLSAGDSITAVQVPIVSPTASLNASAFCGRFYFFSIIPNVGYALTTTPPTGFAFDALANHVITANTPKFDDTNFANDTTVFIYETTGFGGVPVYTVYTGIANVPTTTAAPTNNGTTRTIIETTGGIAKYVFAKVSATTSATSDIIYLPFPSYSTSYEAGVTYYEKYAIVNGVVETSIRVPVGDKDAVGVFTSTNKSAANVYTIISAAADVKTGILSNSGSVLMAGDAAYLYNSNTKVYYINTLGAVTELTGDSIALSAIDKVYAKLIPATSTASVIYVMAQPALAPSTLTLAAEDGITIGNANMLTGAGTATGFTAAGNDEISITASAAPTNCTLSMTINGVAYTSGATYTIAAAGTYTVQVVYTDSISGAVYTNNYTLIVTA